MDRKKFQRLIEKTIVRSDVSVEELNAKLAPLRCALTSMLPNRLYRYRAVNEYNLESLSKGQVWMSLPVKFNDPFDSLPRFDKKNLQAAIGAWGCEEFRKLISLWLSYESNVPKQIKSMLSDCDLQEVLESLKLQSEQDNDKVPSPLEGVLFLSLLPDIVHRMSFVACFSEVVDSKLMWSHYADSHKGFVLGYDLRHHLNQPTDKMILPVIYSKERFDALELLTYIVILGTKFKPVNPDILNSFKLLIYKSPEWRYEKEWRLILHNKNVTSGVEGLYVPEKPNSIYYGCRISNSDKEKLHEIAVKMHLEEFSVYIDNSVPEFKLSVERL